MRTTIALGISLLVFLLTACSSEFEAHNPGLANRGMLPVSTTDAFLGANLFLSKQMERSTYLYNFLKSRGGPAAIELNIDSGEAPRLVLYYPKSKEVYAAERHFRPVAGQKQPSADWVVRGPYAIERKDFKELERMEATLAGEPVFFVWGKPVRFTKTGDSPTYLAGIPRISDRAVTPVLPPTPPPTPKPTPKSVKKAAPPLKEDPDTALIRDFKPLNSDQQALQIAKGYAERAENGDVIHTVKVENETLATIADWYTGAAKNGDEITILNGLASKDVPLVQGARIRIPLILLKKIKSMP